MSKNKKHVWIAQCVRILLFTLFVCCTIFIPFSITDDGIVYSFSKFPLMGDASIADNFIFVVQNLQQLTNLSEEIMIYVSYAYEYCLYAFYGILALDFIFALVLIITRLNLLRVLFRIVVILCGFVMLAILVLCLGYIVAYIYSAFASGDFNNLLPVLQEKGIIFAFGLTIFSGIMIKKQFSWFEADAI